MDIADISIVIFLDLMRYSFLPSTNHIFVNQALHVANWWIYSCSSDLGNSSVPVYAASSFRRHSASISFSHNISAAHRQESLFQVD